MLYVVTTNNLELTWHVGEGTLQHAVESQFGKNAGRIVDTVQADGDELVHIVTRLSGIRVGQTGWSTRWNGEDARFIVENL